MFDVFPVVHPEDTNRTALGLDHIHQDLDGRCFSSSVGTDEP
jgi:hypothetical protein